MLYVYFLATSISISFSIQLTNAIAENNTSGISNLINKGEDLYNLGNYDEAIKYYDKALSIDPNNIQALYSKGLAIYNWDKYEAIKYYDKALSIDPNNTHALYSKGLALDSLGDRDEAIKYYDKALFIDPNNDDILLQKHEALFALKRMDFMTRFVATWLKPTINGSWLFVIMIITIIALLILHIRENHKRKRHKNHS